MLSSHPDFGRDNRVVHKRIPDELIASEYKDFPFLICLVSGAVLNDDAMHK